MAHAVQSKTFAELTEEDLENPLGLNLDIHLIQPSHTHLSSWFVPDETVKPSPLLLETLERIRRLWSLATESSRRTMIDAILLEALAIAENKDPTGKTFRVFPDVDYDFVSDSNYGVYGTIDYVMAHSSADIVADCTKDTSILVVVAKRGWSGEAIPASIGAGGAVLRRRQQQGKKGPVFFIVTTGTIWRFYVVSNDGVVRASDAFLWEAGSAQRAIDLQKILYHLTYILGILRSLSPRPAELDPEEIEKARDEFEAQLNTTSIEL